MIIIIKINSNILQKEWNVTNKPIKVGQEGKGGQGKRIYSIFGKAITLSAEGGGSGSKTGLYLVNNILRKLTPRECTRLQGFPETFKINVSDNQAWKQFGNSVSVNVLQLIIKKIVDDNIFLERINKNEFK